MSNIQISMINRKTFESGYLKIHNIKKSFLTGIIFQNSTAAKLNSCKLNNLYPTFKTTSPLPE